MIGGMLEITTLRSGKLANIITQIRESDTHMYIYTCIHTYIHINTQPTNGDWYICTVAEAD